MTAIAYDGETIRMASKSMRFAIEELDKACDSVNEAVETLTDTPLGDQIASFLMDMESILSMMKEMQKTLGKEGI